VHPARMGNIGSLPRLRGAVLNPAQRAWRLRLERALARSASVG
jgi:hypothetical protein